SFQNHHVTANIYIPNGKGVFPAALLFCGHENEAKATESYQKTAILFAKNGFVVLVVDPISQGERYQLTDSAGKPLTRGGTTAHTLLNEGSSLVGKSTPADELWDNVRALDYLETRPEVDTSKIGCLGNSGGGMQTIYFAGYEKRVKIFAPCSYLANRERTLEISGAADGCAQMPGEGKEYLELSDFLIASAPKPILVLAGRYDFIDYSGTLMAVNDLKKVYTSFHQSGKIQLFTYDDGHGISKPKREAAITWFRKWFYNDSTKIIEGDIVTLPQRDLLCSKTGQVSTDFPNEVSLSERNLKQFDNLKESRKAFLKHDSNFIHKKIAELLGLNLHDKKINVDTTGAVKNNNIIYKKLILRKKDEIPLPVLIINSKGQRPDKIIIWLNEKGKDELADSLSLIQSYLDKNDAVFLCDVSGTGETEDNPEFNDKKFYNREYRNALLALHIGKSMVGLRTADLLTLLSFIKSVTAYKDVPIEINATGFTTISALQAALFSNQIVTLNLYNGIKSYKDILENPIEKNWYSYVVNDCLKYYDLPDLVNLIRKNKVNLSGTTDLLK
ncbi:MAG: acetylxylan esterase, partial [Ginsengibacter sp.]